MKEDQYLRQLLHEQPTPPRKLRLLEVYQRELRKKGMLISGTVGLLGACGIWIFIGSRSFDLDLGEWVLLAVLMFISVMAFAAAILGPFMRHKILRDGVVANGKIVEVNHIEGSDSTLGAVRNGGIAIAKILVQNGKRSFVSDWEVDDPSWREVTKGTQLRLFIPPDKDMVTDVLGIIETTQSGSGEH
jgi:hypothetical protein